MTLIETHREYTVADSHEGPTVVEHEQPRLFGIIAEFDDVTEVTVAARACRDAGYRLFDVHSPFPIHGIDEAIGIRPTILPWIVLGCGIGGLIGGLVLCLFTMATDIGLPGPGLTDRLHGYQYMISGKPYASLPAFIPVVFETTILIASFGAVFGMFLLNKLPLLSHPLFTSDRFRRATDDRFFLAIEAKDGKFDPHRTAAFLREHGATTTELIQDD